MLLHQLITGIYRLHYYNTIACWSLMFMKKGQEGKKGEISGNVPWCGSCFCGYNVYLFRGAVSYRQISLWRFFFFLNSNLGSLRQACIFPSLCIWYLGFISCFSVNFVWAWHCWTVWQTERNRERSSKDNNSPLRNLENNSLKYYISCWQLQVCLPANLLSQVFQNPL